MDKYDVIKTINYIGNKKKSLDFIITEIKEITKQGDIICDLMAGSNAVAYALKRDYTVYTNDIQYYSFVISKAIIENNSNIITSNDAKKDLYANYYDNLKNKYYSFIYDNYKDIYYSEKQCLEIDSIRYAIDKIEDKYIKALYLTALLNTASMLESTFGFFTSSSIGNNEKKNSNVWSLFSKNFQKYKNIILTNYKNKAFNMNYKDLINSNDFDKVSCVYIDPPYSNEQYSRLYHILETIAKYDNPKLEYSAKYRADRFKSEFSSKMKVKKEFKEMLTTLSKKNKKVVLSYSSTGLLKYEDLKGLFINSFNKVKILGKKASYASFGKENIKAEELLFIGYNE